MTDEYKMPSTLPKVESYTIDSASASQRPKWHPVEIDPTVPPPNRNAFENAVPPEKFSSIRGWEPTWTFEHLRDEIVEALNALEKRIARLEERR